MTERDTIPSVDNVAGARGIRMRLALCEAEEIRSAYLNVLGDKRELPLRACPWWVLLAVGFALGGTMGMVCGATAAGAHVAVTR